MVFGFVGKNQVRKDPQTLLKAFSLLKEKCPGKSILYFHTDFNSGVYNLRQSAFDFGFSTGVAHGMFAAWGLRIELITPQAWKKAAGLLKTEKDAARFWAMNKWPDKANWFERVKDSGRADAAAIAWVGLQLEKNNA